MQTNKYPFEVSVPQTDSFEDEELADIAKFMDMVGLIFVILTITFFILTVAAQLYIRIHQV